MFQVSQHGKQDYRIEYHKTIKIMLFNQWTWQNSFDNSYTFQPSCVHVRGAANVKVVENKISFTPYAGIKVYVCSLSTCFY